MCLTSGDLEGELVPISFQEFVHTVIRPNNRSKLTGDPTHERQQRSCNFQRRPFRGHLPNRSGRFFCESLGMRRMCVFRAREWTTKWFGPLKVTQLNGYSDAGPSTLKVNTSDTIRPEHFASNTDSPSQDRTILRASSDPPRSSIDATCPSSPIATSERIGPSMEPGASLGPYRGIERSSAHRASASPPPACVWCAALAHAPMSAAQKTRTTVFLTQSNLSTTA